MIRINGKSFNGRNLIIANGKIIIDGQDVTPDGKDITIHVEGSVDTLKVDVCDEILIKGPVNSVSTVSGDVKIEGNVLNGASTVSGDILCKELHGNASTVSGDIKTD
jgi:hypothetical protein